MKNHPFSPKGPPSEYETLEKKKSTVLDNPDVELDPMQSVQRSGNLYYKLSHDFTVLKWVQLDFKLSANLDRNTLTVDNTHSTKDLKSTHFSVCNILNVAYPFTLLTKIFSISKAWVRCIV